MNESTYVYFNSPPSPFYLESGSTFYEIGDAHPNRHRLQLFDLIIVKEGCLHLGEDEENWEVKEGEALLLLPDRFHYSVKPTQEQTSFYWIHFQTMNEWHQTAHPLHKFELEQHQQCFNPTNYTIQMKKHTKLHFAKHAYQLIEQMHESQHLLEPKAYWQKQQAFEALLQMLDQRQHTLPASSIVRLAEEVERFIRNHYKESINNERLSATFNYHYNYITRAMKQVYGYSPNEYITKLRIDQAKILLLNTQQTIASIALSIGFDSAPYFTNCFQKHTGESPSKFRKRYGELLEN